MHPLDALMMAANGHKGLPPVISHGPGGPGDLGPQPQAPQGPEPATPDQGQDSPADKEVATATEQALLRAASAVSDPELKAVFSQCLAALHKYLAADQKEQHQALAGKLSPKVMAQAYGRG